MRVLFIAAAMFAFTANAGAIELSEQIPTIPKATSLVVGEETLQPIGHYEFCQRNLEECFIETHDEPLELNREIWMEVNRINRSVNDAVTPKDDPVIRKNYAEVWSYPDSGFGDCEDYVLEKRKRLHDEVGISLSNLLITVVKRLDIKKGPKGHAILTLRTDRGDYVLDNIKPEVLPWAAVPYKFLKRQSATHTGRWVALVGDDGQMLTAASE